MIRRTIMSKFSVAVPVVGLTSAATTAFALGLMSTMRGRPPWASITATSHVLHGPAAGRFDGFDLSHTVLGGAIHITSCFFWAAVAVVSLRLVTRGSTSIAWTAGLLTAGVAAFVDYGLMPVRLRPGWELVLPVQDVVLSFVAMAIGIAIGLAATRTISHEINPLPTTNYDQR